MEENKTEGRMIMGGWRDVILNRMVREGLWKKVVFEQKFEGGEGVCYNISGGRALQTEGSAPTNVQRQSLTCIPGEFHGGPWGWSRGSQESEKEREAADVVREARFCGVL